jgi:hypothetical protein
MPGPEQPVEPVAAVVPEGATVAQTESGLTIVNYTVEPSAENRGDIHRYDLNDGSRRVPTHNIDIHVATHEGGTNYPDRINTLVLGYSMVMRQAKVRIELLPGGDMGRARLDAVALHTGSLVSIMVDYMKQLRSPDA